MILQKHQTRYYSTHLNNMVIHDANHFHDDDRGNMSATEDPTGSSNHPLKRILPYRQKKRFDPSLVRATSNGLSLLTSGGCDALDSSSSSIPQTMTGATTRVRKY
jgi:hypothetical protein